MNSNQRLLLLLTPIIWIPLMIAVIVVNLQGPDGIFGDVVYECKSTRSNTIRFYADRIYRTKIEEMNYEFNGDVVMWVDGESDFICSPIGIKEDLIFNPRTGTVLVRDGTGDRYEAGQ